MAGSRSEAPSPPINAQNMRIGTMLWASVIAMAPTAYPHSPRM